MGATHPDQLEMNLHPLGLELSADQMETFESASALESNELDHYFEPTMQAQIHGNVKVQRSI